jgi:hypothetical protein
VQCSDLLLAKLFSNRNRVSNDRMFRIGAGLSRVRFPTGIKKFFYPLKLLEWSCFLPSPLLKQQRNFSPQRERDRDVNLTTPLQLVPTSRKSGAMPHLPPTCLHFVSIEKFIFLLSKRSRSYTTNRISKFALLFKHQMLNFFLLSDQRKGTL